MPSLFSDLFLPLALAFITLGMGLSLTQSDFRNIFIQPKAVITGLCSQMILLPLIAYFLASILNIDPVYKMGLMIIAACPGGATSNLITYLLRGNVALSISMTALNSLITLITIPLVVSISLNTFMGEEATIHLRVGNTLLHIFLITILPAYLGTRIRKWDSEFADRIERPLRIILPILLLMIYSGVVFLDEGTEAVKRSDFLSLFPHALLLHVSAMSAGLLVARIMRLNLKNRYTIAIEVGLQNSGLAIVVAVTILHSHAMALVPVVYGSFTFFTTLFFGWLIKRLSWYPGVSEKGR